MAETANLALPLLAAGQAQKHVTMNEALGRLDLLVMLSVRSRGLSSPPGGAAEGDRYVVAAGGGGAWTGRDNEVAIFSNGGWAFATPAPGWRAFAEDEATDVVFASGVWTAATPATAAASLSVLEFDHVVTASAPQVTAGRIPAGALVFGVTARVTQAVTGAAAWSLGVAGAETRYGAGLGVAAGSLAQGARGAPLAYAADVALTLTAEGGAFSGGRVRFAIHYMTLEPPALT